MEQQIAPAYIQLVTGLIGKKAEPLRKNINGMPPSVTLMRDALNDDGPECDAGIRGSCRATKEPWNNGSRHMISLNITASHSPADAMQTSATMQRW